MKIGILVIILCVMFMHACSPAPQVTAAPEATHTPLPTETPVPTPTLHPDFLALQGTIAASGARFYLNPDGTISDGVTPIKGIQANREGIVTLTVNGEQVEIDLSIMNFDDEKGFSIEGWSDDDGDGKWEEIVTLTPEQTAFVAQMNEIGVDSTSYVCGENGKCRDLEGKVVFQGGRAEFESLQPLLEMSGKLAPTDIAPLGPGDAQIGSFRPPAIANPTFGVDLFNDFVINVTNKDGIKPFTTNKTGFVMVMLDPDINAWGIIADETVNGKITNQYLVFRYEDESGKVVVTGIPVNEITSNEIRNFWLNKK